MIDTVRRLIPKYPADILSKGETRFPYNDIIRRTNAGMACVQFNHPFRFQYPGVGQPVRVPVGKINTRGKDQNNKGTMQIRTAKFTRLEKKAARASAFERAVAKIMQRPRNGKMAAALTLPRCVLRIPLPKVSIHSLCPPLTKPFLFDFKSDSVNSYIGN